MELERTEPKRRPRGRPRSFDPQVALGAATERFRTHGFAATTLDDLVAATGLARPSLYAAFGDKHALYLAALAITHKRVAASIDRLIAADLPGDEALRRIFSATIDGFIAGEAGPAGCIAISTATAEAVSDPAIRAALRDFLAMQDRGLTALFARAGFARPEGVAHIVTSVIHSLSIRARAGTSRAELEAIANDCMMQLAR